MARLPDELYLMIFEFLNIDPLYHRYNKYMQTLALTKLKNTKEAVISALRRIIHFNRLDLAKILKTSIDPTKINFMHFKNRALSMDGIITLGRLFYFGQNYIIEQLSLLEYSAKKGTKEMFIFILTGFYKLADSDSDEILKLVIKRDWEDIFKLIWKRNSRNYEYFIFNRIVISPSFYPDKYVRAHKSTKILHELNKNKMIKIKDGNVCLYDKNNPKVLHEMNKNKNLKKIKIKGFPSAVVVKRIVNVVHTKKPRIAMRREMQKKGKYIHVRRYF
jgi:hypothetical protein